MKRQRPGPVLGGVVGGVALLFLAAASLRSPPAPAPTALATRPCPTPPTAPAHAGQSMLAGCGAAAEDCGPRGCPGASFSLPQYSEDGSEYNENSRGWTSSGVLDERGRAAATREGGARLVPRGDLHGEVMERERETEYPGLDKVEGASARGGGGTTCGCAVCPCRGDDDIDTVWNGGWYWPIDTRPLPKEELHLKTGKREKKGGGEHHAPPKKAVEVQPTPPPEVKTVYKTRTRTRTVYKTRYVPVPELRVREKKIYVPVYDDPFWNPRTDGRLSGEGIGAPHLNPRGALSYRRGAWYEHNAPRQSMMDRLGGTLDADRDVDQPADLGVWWADSLPSSRMARSLDDGDSF